MKVDLRNHQQDHVVSQEFLAEIRFVDILRRIVILVRIQFFVVVPVILLPEQLLPESVDDVDIITVGDHQRIDGPGSGSVESNDRVNLVGPLRRTHQVQELADVVVGTEGFIRMSE